MQFRSTVLILHIAQNKERRSLLIVTGSGTAPTSLNSGRFSKTRKDLRRPLSVNDVKNNAKQLPRWSLISVLRINVTKHERSVFIYFVSRREWRVQHITMQFRFFVRTDIPVLVTQLGVGTARIYSLLFSIDDILDNVKCFSALTMLGRRNDPSSMNIGITRLNEILAAESKRQQVVRATAIFPRGICFPAWSVSLEVTVSSTTAPLESLGE